MEILNVIEGSEITEPTWAFWLMLALFALAALSFSFAVEEKSSAFAIVSIWILSIILLDGSEGTGEYKPNRYEVIITDPNYIIDATKYEIVQVRDKILILKDKLIN